jgi:hypothetical protein
METAEREAFIESYLNNVAHHDKDEVSSFLDDFLDKSRTHSAKEEDAIYEKHECYTSVLDSLWVWCDAVKYAGKRLAVSLDNSLQHIENSLQHK